MLRAAVPVPTSSAVDNCRRSTRFRTAEAQQHMGWPLSFTTLMNSWTGQRQSALVRHLDLLLKKRYEDHHGCSSM
jgi:hypothetical protein